MTTQKTPYLKMVLVLAKLRICSRTTPMPLSSEALSWNKREGPNSNKHISFTSAYFRIKAHFQNHGSKLLRRIQLFGNRQNSGCLPSSRRSIEEQVRKTVFGHELLNWGWIQKDVRNHFEGGSKYRNGVHSLVVIMSLWDISSSN